MSVERPSKMLEARLEEAKRVQREREQEEEEAARSSSSTFWVPINGGMQASVHRRTRTWDNNHRDTPSSRVVDKNHNTIITRRRSYTHSKSFESGNHSDTPPGKTSLTRRSLEEAGSKKKAVTKSHSFSAGSNRTIQRASGTWDLAAVQSRRTSDASTTSSNLSSTVSAPSSVRTRLGTQVSI